MRTELTAGAGALGTRTHCGKATTRPEPTRDSSGAAMAEFPSKVSTRTSSPAQGAGASASSLRPDLGFLRSTFGVLMLLQLVSARSPAGWGGRGTVHFWGSMGDSGAAPHLRTQAPPQRRFPRPDAPCSRWGRFQDGYFAAHLEPSYHGALVAIPASTCNWSFVIGVPGFSARHCRPRWSAGQHSTHLASNHCT